MAGEMKTKAIPAMLKEAQDTGLITEGSLAALEAKKLQAEEAIRKLENLHRKGELSKKRMKARIETIRQEIQRIQEETIASDFDDDILS